MWRERWLGSGPQLLNECSHPHLRELAPYGYYETVMMRDKLAVRTNEFKLYLAEFADRRGLPVGQVDTLPLGGFDSSPNATAQGSTRRARRSVCEIPERSARREARDLYCAGVRP